MRIAFLCAAVLSLALFLGQQAESGDVTARSVHPFTDDDSATSLFQLHTDDAAATAFSQCGFKGELRNEGTPLVINGKNDIGSLKVPAGQCASLFTKAGFNSAAEGEMLEIRGPMNVACLSIFKPKDGISTWKERTHSYKMGPCAAKPTKDLAHIAVASAASSTHDLTSIAHKAEEAARGQFGSVVQSFTRKGDDGSAYPYAQHAVVREDMQVMQTGMHSVDDSATDATAVEADTTTEADATDATDVDAAAEETAYPYAEHAEAKAIDEMEGVPNKTATDEAFKWEHEHLGDSAWSKFVLPTDSLTLNNPLMADKDPGPADDEEDILFPKAKNSVGCDKLLGCREPPPPCEDKGSAELCSDYFREGDCQFDFAQRDCKRTCGLCPASQGSVASDAYLGPNGHYYIGANRRRVGAGFGRRRRSPVPKGPAKSAGNSTEPEEETVVKKVPVDILHPDGEETVTEAAPATVSCKECVANFVEQQGCEIWHRGNPTKLAKALGCMRCAEQAAEKCGMVKTDEEESEESESLPEPIEHPNEAASEMAETEAKEKAHVEAEVPAAIVEAAEKAEPAEAAPAEAAPAVAETASNTTSAAENNTIAAAKTATEAAEDAAAAEEAADAKASDESAAAADTADVAAAANAKAAKAEAEAAEAVGTDHADVAQAAAQAAEAEATAAQTTAEQTQKTADVNQAAAATAQEAAATAEGAAVTPAPAPTPSEEQVIAEESHDWAEEQMRGELKNITQVPVSADALVQEDFSVNGLVQ